MEALKGLLSPKRGPSIMFRAMTESRNLIDSEAEQVDTQLIVHSDGMAVRDREPVTLYRLEDHDSVPVWHAPLILETGQFRRPELRSRWTLQESHHLWQGYASGTLQAAKAKLSFDPKSMRAIVLGVGVSIFFVCIIAAVVLNATAGPDQPVVTQNQQEGYTHGFVEPEAAGQGEETGDGGAAAPEAGGGEDSQNSGAEGEEGSRRRSRWRPGALKTDGAAGP